MLVEVVFKLLIIVLSLVLPEFKVTVLLVAKVLLMASVCFVWTTLSAITGATAPATPPKVATAVTNPLTKST